MNARKIALTIFFLVVLVVAAVGIVWLAGMTFFALSKTLPFGKTDLSTWWVYWQAYKGDPVIKKRLLVSLLIPTIVVLGTLAIAVFNAMRERRTLYGEARFAHHGEIEKAGLLGDKGIIVGKWRDRYLMFPGMQFVLLAAPTRSGKGVGIVVPNLLNWPESVVVLDVKQENFMITSGVRHRLGGQECYLFNPFATDGRTHRYNPLGYISDNPDLRAMEILAIGYSLYPGEGKDAFFDDAARNLFLGLTLYLCETPELPRTIGELLRQSSGNGQPVRDYLQGLITARNFIEVEDEGEDGEPVVRLEPITQWNGEGLPPLSKECVDALNRFCATSDNTLSSIMATFNVPLTLWTSAVFDAATSANDFDLRDVRKRRMSIYLGIPANKMAESELILNLFFTQLVNLNTDELLHSRKELKHTCMLLMDEFTAPGRIGNIDKANAYMAGYGLRLVTIVQSPGQLQAEPRRGYGREGARTLMTNHALHILYAPREQQDANEYSEMLGTETFKSRSRSRQLAGRSGASESESDQRRPLMLPQELKEMSQREQIINLENTKPIKCEKIAYYADPKFVDRLKQISPSLKALGDKLPSKDQLEHAWGSGELAAPVPRIDLSLHRAKVERRVRDMTPADIEKPIDLDRVAIDRARLDAFVLDGGEPPENIEEFVNDFFDALDAGSLPAPLPEEQMPQDAETGVDMAELYEIGAGPAASAAELAALDAEIAREAAEAGIEIELNVGPMLINLDLLDTPQPEETDAGGSIAFVSAGTDDASDTEAEADANADDTSPELSPDEMDALYESYAFADDSPDYPDFADYPDELIAMPVGETEEDEPASDAAAAPRSGSSTPILDLSALDRP